MKLPYDDLIKALQEQWPNRPTSRPGLTTGGRDYPWKCPECGEGHRPKPDFRCNCNEPIMIYVQPGQHVHLKCPVHGDRKIYGSLVTW